MRWHIVGVLALSILTACSSSEDRGQVPQTGTPSAEITAPVADAEQAGESIAEPAGGGIGDTEVSSDAGDAPRGEAAVQGDGASAEAAAEALDGGAAEGEGSATGAEPAQAATEQAAGDRAQGEPSGQAAAPPADEVESDAAPAGGSQAETTAANAEAPDPDAVPPPSDPEDDAVQAAAPPVDTPDSIERPPGWVPEDPANHPLAIQRLRGLSYPGSDLVVVQELPAGSSYSRSVATYQSEGLTIRGLLTVPSGEPPASGWPVIIFNHGYIPPAQYRTTERYVAYQDAFARNGYITYKSDYRGHGSSEGEPGSSRGSPAYMIDVMNAMASVIRRPDADADRVGMWGHSMGGLITLRAMVVTDRIKAGVIWAGVVASYPDLYNRIGRERSRSDSPWRWRGRRSWRYDFVEAFGTPEENPAAWDALSANSHLDDISGPLQLHHGTADSSVAVIQSTRLQEQMEAAGQPSELFVYQGDDHNLSGSINTALARSVEFVDRYVKGGG